jgi:hypothetical protein
MSSKARDDKKQKITLTLTVEYEALGDTSKAEHLVGWLRDKIAKALLRVHISEFYDGSHDWTIRGSKVVFIDPPAPADQAAATPPKFGNGVATDIFSWS